MIRTWVLNGVIVLALLLCLGVLLMSNSLQAGSYEKPQYGDLTDKEDCIHNYVLSIRDRDANRMTEVLAEDYVYSAVWVKGEWGREAEVRQNTNMWERLTIFGLIVRPGEWSQLSEYRGKRCDGCWESVRGYLLVYSYPEKVATIRVDKGHFRIVVEPVTEQGTVHYKIRAIEGQKAAEVTEMMQAPE